MAALTPVLFALTVAFLAVHELDAVRNHEWRFFFSPFGVDDDTGYRVFTALHVPLFAVVFTFYSAPAFQTGLDLFAVAHGGVHLALRDHPLVAAVLEAFPGAELSVARPAPPGGAAAAEAPPALAEIDAEAYAAWEPVDPWDGA